MTRRQYSARWLTRRCIKGPTLGDRARLANILVGPIRNMRLSTDGVCIKLLTLLKSRVLHATSLCPFGFTKRGGGFAGRDANLSPQQSRRARRVRVRDNMVAGPCPYRKSNPGGPDDAMFLPHEANPGRIEFSETTTVLIYANKMAPASGPFPFFRVV